MCWRPCVALTLGVGYVAVDTPWDGVPSHPFGVSGTLFTSFGVVYGNLGRTPYGWNLDRR